MEKEYSVRITDYALEQLQEIQRYIAFSLQAPDTAARWREKLKKELGTLSCFPNRVPLTEEEAWHSEGIHKMIIGNYLAYFWINEEGRTVQIISVIYVKRDQARQLEKMEME